MGNAAARGKSFYDSILPNNSSQQKNNVSLPQPKLSLDQVDLYHELGVSEVSESARKASVLSEYKDICSEILPSFLYVSNLSVARDITRLRELGISHIINCCSKLDDEDDGTSFIRLQLALRDDVEENLTPFLHIVVQFIQSAKQFPKSKVLIHCHQGVSRSCALAIAYLMYATNASHHDSMTIVKQKRAICSPNTAFICQLLEWQHELTLIRSNCMEAKLFRLAPHAAHDANFWLLKPCFHPNSRKHIFSQFDAPNHAEVDSIPLTIGVYCILDTQQATVTIYSSPNCVIPDPQEKARQLLQPILATYFYEKEEVKVNYIQEKVEDHPILERFKTFLRDELYHYDLELEWTQRRRSIKESKGSTQTSSPQFFILEGDHTGNWELISNYDANDLTSDSAAIIMDPETSFLWIGAQCSLAHSKLYEDAKLHCRKYGFNLLIIQHDGSESDAFWSVFERGY
uniref:Uncharacterized protein AlNc14C57G4284 n=1 Tax=Albugo laibachii Nc14 TaxID=890382 RepID=F0WCA1_9STRA|nr:conserved hypothetical protein [Albugo laibachii Nc14]|eukprot:CCA18815.1 conserved hypothetical protein [Albugo laibachii Nc14]